MSFVNDKFENLSFEECFERIKEYMERYHPAGYGTRVTDMSLSINGWTLCLQRYNSCD